MKNKRIIHHVTKQYMKENKARTLTTYIGIVFMIILMTCVFVGKDSVLRFLAKTGEADKGKWHVNAYDVSEKQYEEIKTLDYVKDTAISYDLGFTEIESSNFYKPYLFIKGYSKNDFDWMNINITEGRIPENASEIVISKSILADTDIKLGDEISAEFFTRKIKGIKEGNTSNFFAYSVSVSYNEIIDVPQAFPYFGENDSFEEIHEMSLKTGTYKVVGFIDEPNFENEACSYYGALTYIDEEYPKNQNVNMSIIFDLDKPGVDDYFYDIYSILSQDRDEVNYEVNDMVLIFSSNSSSDQFNILVDAVVIFFTLLTVFVSVILIYNVFNISFDDRKKYLGMLSSVGATRAQKRSSIYYEAFSLLLAAIPVGIGAGLLVVKIGLVSIKPYILRLANVVATKNLATLPVNLMIKPSAIIIIILVSIVTVFISAYLPALKIGKIGPIESIKGNDKSTVKKFKTNKKAFDKGNAVSLLASNQIKYQKQKTNSIVRAMAAFMVILIVTSYGASSVTKVVSYKLVEQNTINDHTTGYDFIIYENEGHGDVYTDLINEIRNTDEGVRIEESYTDFWAVWTDMSELSKEYKDTLHHIANQYFPQDMTDEEFEEYASYGQGISIISYEKEKFLEIAKKCGADMSISSDVSKNPILVFMNVELSTDNYSFSSEKPRSFYFAELNKVVDKEIGETFNTKYYSSKVKGEVEYPFTIAGYATRDKIDEYVTIHGENIWVITCNEVAKSLNDFMVSQDDSAINGVDIVLSRTAYVTVSDRNSQLAKMLYTMSERDIEGDWDVTVQCTYGDAAFVQEMGKNIAETINVLINVVAVCFIIFSSIVCFINMHNTIKARRDARKKDMAMLRSIGMVQSQMDKMLLYENIKMSIKSIIISTIISVPLMHILKILIVKVFGRVMLPFPVVIYVMALVIAIISVLIITKVIYKKSENDNILEDMRRETV